MAAMPNRGFAVRRCVSSALLGLLWATSFSRRAMSPDGNESQSQLDVVFLAGSSVLALGGGLGLFWIWLKQGRKLSRPSRRTAYDVIFYGMFLLLMSGFRLRLDLDDPSRALWPLYVFNCCLAGLLVVGFAFFLVWDSRHPSHPAQSPVAAINV